MSALPDDTGMGAVTLRVADLGRQIDFYRDRLGLRVLDDEGGVARLGAGEGGVPLVVLAEVPGAPPEPPRSSGLFHFALLLPGRVDLGATILGLRERGWDFQGWADHAVSEAAYLADAEGNGIELYADRPRETWRRVGGELHMTTEPLDLAGLLSQAPGPSRWLPPGTVMGHVHLKVPSLAAAEAFYVRRMGFGVMARSYPGALFVSAGGYHHHLGLNVWSGEGVPPPPEGARGLISFDVVVPGEAARSRVLEGATEGALDAPGGTVIHVVSPGA